MALTILEFVARWQRSTLSERAAAQSHFIDLCEILGQPRPAEVDQEGDTYTFEKGVTKTAGGDGFADVWMRGYFAWEYKGKHKDLAAAYQQLLQYREDLENPPLLVVCDLDRFEVPPTTPTRRSRSSHSNWPASFPTSRPPPASSRPWKCSARFSPTRQG